MSHSSLHVWMGNGTFQNESSLRRVFISILRYAHPGWRWHSITLLLILNSWMSLKKPHIVLILISPISVHQMSIEEHSNLLLNLIIKPGITKMIWGKNFCNWAPCPITLVLSMALHWTHCTCWMLAQKDLCWPIIHHQLDI